MGKITPLSDVVIGQTFTDSVYVLRTFMKNSDKCTLTLSDKSGSLDCYMPLSRYDSVYEDMVGGAVKVNGIVMVGQNLSPVGKIRSLAVAKEGSFNVDELFDGLSEEKKSFYIGEIGSLITKISDPACRQLCNVILSDAALEKLSCYPASLAYHGKYRGGALAATYNVTRMCMQSGLVYLKGNHGMYDSQINWSVLITSALLMYSAIPDYLIDNPWRKSQEAIDRGYMSILQSVIERAVYVNDIPITAQRLARILNVLGSSVAMKTAVKATCVEGVILRHQLIMYEELDMIDADLSKHEPREDENYFFDKRLQRNVATQKVKEVDAA